MIKKPMTNTEQPSNDEQFQLLLDTVERLRGERYSHIDAALVRDILRLHSDGGATDGELVRGAEQAVERHIAQGADNASD